MAHRPGPAAGPESTEDVLQTTWLALVGHADSISDARAVLQWLLVAAKREAWRVLRNQNRQTPAEIEDDAIADAGLSAAREPGPARRRPAVAVEPLRALPDRCRELLRVIAFSDRPDYAELARALRMPVGSIGPTRGRCLAKLRAGLTADARWELR